MTSVRPRSSSSERASKASSLAGQASSPLKSARGPFISSDSSTPMSTDPKPSPKGSTEKRVLKVSELQHQLSQKQEEMKRLKEERFRALKELQEAKRRISSQEHLYEDLELFRNRVDFLEMEVEKAKDSERSMLQSLISLTKQHEQTKISLEEAKLEISTLEEGMKTFGRLGSRGSNGQNLDIGGGTLDMNCVEEEIMLLRNELRLALRAEEKSKKAMDDLAIALKEVSTEANQIKGELLSAKLELENVRAEAENSNSLFQNTEEKRRAACELSERLRSEMEESIAAWNAQETGFINCINVSEDEVGKVRQENARLSDSLRLMREENVKLRDILKQAVNEASVVKEALEITRNENCHLKDMLAEKENTLRGMREEYESLKVSEAAALDGVNELKGFLATNSNMGPSTVASETIMEASKPRSAMPRSSSTSGVFELSNEASNDSSANRTVAWLTSDRWKAENARSQNGGRRHNLSASSKTKGSIFDPSPSPERDREHIFASMSNISDWKVPSSGANDDPVSLSFDDYDHVDHPHLNAETGSKHMKKKHVTAIFGEIFRRRSFHKQR